MNFFSFSPHFPPHLSQCNVSLLNPFCNVQVMHALFELRGNSVEPRSLWWYNHSIGRKRSNKQRSNNQQRDCFVQTFHPLIWLRWISPSPCLRTRVLVLRQRGRTPKKKREKPEYLRLQERESGCKKIRASHQIKLRSLWNTKIWVFLTITHEKKCWKTLKEGRIRAFRQGEGFARTQC